MRFRSWEKITEEDELFQGAQTVVKMLLKRGYKVDDEEQKFISDGTYKDYRKKLVIFENYVARRKKETASLTIRDALKNIYYHNEKKGCTVVYINRMTASGRAAYVRSEILDAELSTNFEKRDSLIFILPGTPEENKAEQDLIPLGVKVKVEIFFNYHILSDPTEHFLYLDHKIMSDEEKRELLIDSGKRFTNFPRISPNDAIIKFYDIPRGSMLEITRVNSLLPQIASETLFFRAY